MDWMYANSFIDANVAMMKQFGTAGTGMVYKRDVNIGEELFAVPIDSMVYTSNPHISPRTKRIVEIFRERMRAPGYHPDDFELTEMALIVMFERRDPDSFWYLYLNTIQDPLCPAFYDEDELKMLEFEWLTRWRGYFLADAIQNFQTLMEQPEFELTKTPSMVSEFMWACSSVLQRSFDWGPDSRREYVMVPYLDMINHEPNISNNYYYTGAPISVKQADGSKKDVTVKRSMVIAADANHKAGDSVSISYSSRSNSVQLLLQYGFLTADNPNDYVLFQLTGEDDVLARARDAGASIFISMLRNAPVPFDLLQSIAAFTGNADVSIQTAQLLRTIVERSISQFSTSLEDDIKQRDTMKHGRATYPILSYRIEAKKTLNAVIKSIDELIVAMKSGGALQKHPAHDRKDWPIRHIPISLD
jgi:hypothetical protein